MWKMEGTFPGMGPIVGDERGGSDEAALGRRLRIRESWRVV